MAGTATWGATTSARPPGDGPLRRAFPQPGRLANGLGAPKDGQPGTGPAVPPTARPGAAQPAAPRPAVTEPGTGSPETAKPARGGTRPKTGVPPWEITDSFLAVPHAGASATPAFGEPTSQPGTPRGANTRGGGPAADEPSTPRGTGAGDSGTAASQPRNPGGTATEGGSPADPTESFPVVSSGAEQRSFPGANPADSTESFPAARPRADLEDAFRLFPPMRETGNQPPADGQD